MKKVSMIVAMALVMSLAYGCNKGEGVVNVGVESEGAVEVVEENGSKVVEDAVYKEDSGTYTSPIGFELEGIIEDIKGSVEGVEFEDSYSEMIENAGMSGFFDFEKSHTIVGYSGENRDNTIAVTVKQYANFDKASHIMVQYNKSDEKLKNAAESLLMNLYGEEWITPLLSNEDYSTEYRSKTGEYLFTTSRTTEIWEDATYVNITLDYAPYYARENIIDQFTVYEKTEPLYREMSMFKDVPLKEMGNVLGNVWGDFKHAVLVRNTNSKASAVDGNTRSMELTNAVVFEDGMQSAVEIRALVQAGDNMNSELAIKGSTPYCETAEEAIGKAVKMLEFLGERALEVTEEEKSVGIQDKEWTIMQFGKTLKQMVYVDLEADETGYYAVFETFTVIQ